MLSCRLYPSLCLRAPIWWYGLGWLLVIPSTRAKWISSILLFITTNCHINNNQSQETLYCWLSLVKQLIHHNFGFILSPQVKLFASTSSIEAYQHSAVFINDLLYIRASLSACCACALCITSTLFCSLSSNICCL